MGVFKGVSRVGGAEGLEYIHICACMHIRHVRLISHVTRKVDKSCDMCAGSRAPLREGSAAKRRHDRASW